MIAEFYEDCDIFITGGSGAVGKALIEKLLRSCNVRRVFLLLREKKNHKVEQRLERLKKAKIFRTILAAKPEVWNKLVAIPGDAVLPKLGISAEYTNILKDVAVVFHCAATVRFDEPLKVAMELNVGGTLEALRFAESLKKLKIFMHCSTFYSNPYLKHVEHKVYSSPMDWRTCMKMINDAKNQDTLDSLTKKIIVGFPNTYTFTKNLAESVVDDYRERLPVAIYRPSIVLHALREPVPGYPPTLMGAMGLFAAVAAGVLKTVYLGPTTRFDITPQDIGIKGMMTFAFRANQEYARKNGQLEATPVYMTSSYGHSPHTFQQMCELMENYKIWDLAAFEKNFMIPGSIYTSSRLYYKFLVFTKQILPALLGDLLLMLFGRKPALMAIVRKAYLSLEVMQPFMFNNYTSTGLTDMEETLKCTKGTDFDILPDLALAGTDEGLRKICTNMIFSIREFLMNEDPATLPRARKILKIKQYTYNVIRAILAYYVLRWLYGVLMNYVNSSQSVV